MSNDGQGLCPGIALAAEELVRDELQSGVLLAPWPIRLQSGHLYHLVCQKRALRRAPVARFASWIGEQIAAHHIAPHPPNAASSQGQGKGKPAQKAGVKRVR